MAAQEKRRQEAVMVLDERPEPLGEEMAGEETGGEQAHESLHDMAARLHPGVDWARMSPESVRSALGFAPGVCWQGQEYWSGRLARAAGDPLPETSSLAFRLGWRHGKPPKARQRRWRARSGATPRKGGKA